MLQYRLSRIFKVILLTVIFSATLNANSYIGCFKDKGNPFGLENRDLNGYYVNKSGMKIKDCINICKAKNFKYAGLENSTQCFCGNSYGKYGESKNCNMKCSGNPNEICGGLWAMSVYSTKETNNNLNNKDLSDINNEAKFGLNVTSIELSDKLDLHIPKIDALIDIEGAKKGDCITAQWISKDAFPKANMTLAKTEVTLEPSKKVVHISYDNSIIPLRVGHYILKIFSKNRLLAVKEFTVVESNKTNNDTTNKAKNYKLKIYLSKEIKKDEEDKIVPVDITDNFANSQHKIYATIPYENLKPKTPFLIEWIVVYDGINFNKVIYKQEGIIKANKGVIKALLTNSQKWPDGVFEVLLRLNGKIVAKKKFTIGDKEHLKKLKLKNSVDIKLDEKLKKRLLKNLKGWMLETIQKRDIKPLYKHSIHTVRDSFNWDEIQKGLEPLFNAEMDWKVVFAQIPKSFNAKKEENGIVKIKAVYYLSDKIDILLEGTFYKEDGEWRLLGFALEPIK